MPRAHQTSVGWPRGRNRLLCASPPQKQTARPQPSTAGTCHPPAWQGQGEGEGEDEDRGEEEGG
eukprot:scaffold88044_cov75-Phaeocystis_antarctica.AAC.8